MTEYSVKQVEVFFQKHDEARAQLSTVQSFMQLYDGHHDDMTKYLKEQYGAAPEPISGSTNDKKRSIFAPMLSWNNSGDEPASAAKRQKGQPAQGADTENQGEAAAANKANTPNLWSKFQQSKQDLAFKVKELTSSADSETLSVQKKVAMVLALWQTAEDDRVLFSEIVKGTNEKTELVMEQVGHEASSLISYLTYLHTLLPHPAFRPHFAVFMLTTYYLDVPIDSRCNGRIEGPEIPEAACVNSQGAVKQTS
jgi:hypothetical protein